MKRLILALLMVASAAISFGQSNQAFQQKNYYASDYGTWQVKGTTPNTYQFQPASLCVIPQPGGGSPFNAFNTNAKVYIQDAVAANSEVLLPSYVIINETLCSVALTTAHNHFSFNLMSGTAGLQEVLNVINGNIPYPVQVYLDRNWYTAVNSIPGQTASAVIAAAKGSTAATLVDQTTAPETYYTWTGSAYTAVANNNGTIAPLGTATAIQNYDSNIFALQGSGWSGSAATLQQFLFQTVVNSGTHPYSLLNIYFAGDATGGNEINLNPPVNFVNGGTVPSGHSFQMTGFALNSLVCTDGGHNLTTASCPTNAGAVALAPISLQQIQSALGNFTGIENANQQFYVSGFPAGGCTVAGYGTYTTQLECAWWSVRAWAEANSAMPILNMGYGYYNINAPLVLPTQSFTSVSLHGAGYQGSTIVANAPMSDAMIYKNETSGTLPNASFENFKMLAGDQAQGCMRLWGLQEPVINNVNCDNVPNGAPFLYQFGEPSNYGQGWIFQLMARNIIGGNSVHYASVAPVITVNTNSGGNPLFTVVSGGSGYATSAEQILYVQFLGNQNGTSDQPCGTMPTDLTATLSGTSIATITGTGGALCTGTFNVQIIPISNIAAGVDDWSSDSSLDDVDPGSTLIGIVQHSGDTTYKHAHPTGTLIGIQNAGGTNNIYKDSEIDTNYQYGFDMQGGANSSVIDGTHSFGNNGDSFAMFHLASNATVQFGPQSSLCEAPYQGSLSDWHEFLMPYGTYEHNGYLPLGSSIAPNDTTCGTALGAIFMQPLTVGGPGHTSATLLNGTLHATGLGTFDAGLAVSGNSNFQNTVTFANGDAIEAVNHGVTGGAFIVKGNTAVSGCSFSASVGGPTAGQFVSGVSGTCTFTVTPGIATSNGLACFANDITTPADKLSQTASSNTAGTLSGTTVSGDVVQFGCIPY